MRAKIAEGVVLWSALSLACSDPSLDVPPRRGGPSVVFEPAATASAVPANVRARVVGSAGAQPWLFQGELSEHYDRELRKGEVAAALRARAVPLSFWSDREDLLLGPLAWLKPGQRYTLALLGLGAVDAWDIADEGAPRAEAFFPPAGRPLQRVSVQCSSAFQGPLPAMALAPGGVSVQATLDSPRVAATTCVTLLAASAVLQPAVLPPSLAGALLVPGAFQPEEKWGASSPASCSGELHFAACIEARDDRVLVTPQSRDTLWLVEAPVARVVVSIAGQRTTLLDGLAPLTSYVLRGHLLTSDADSRAFELELTTTARARHLILSEVLANPLGPEPASEWIELVNDSDEPVELGGLWLEDTTNRSFLPHELLAARESVLLVPSGFRPSALDVTIATGTRLLELTSLGARGLSNAGEALLLVGPGGVVARFPALAAPHAGRSLARRALDGSDDDPAAFAEHGGPGASPGAPNRFD